jgi:O-antigen ligase
VWGVLAAVAALLFSEVPTVASAVRGLLIYAATAMLLVLLGTARPVADDWRIAWRRGPQPFLLLLLGWTIFEFTRAPALLHGYAMTDLLRVLDGIMAYTLCAFCLRGPRQTGMVVTGLIAMGVCLSLYDISLSGQRGGMTDNISLHESGFGTHENAGSLLVLLLPLALAFGLSTAIEEKRRLAAAAAALVLGVAELVARTRSAWIAGFGALTVLAILAIRFPNNEMSPGSSGNRRRPTNDNPFQRLLASPAALIAVTMFLFLIIAGAAPHVLNRFVSIHSALNDESFTSRLEMWSGAARMTAERPLTGWGLGVFPVIQGRWTHSGMSQDEALLGHVGHENLAHDYYVQWAADTGAIGLFLYVAAVVAVLVTACFALRRTTAPPQRALLCGGIATIVGGMIDGVASPAYQFHGVSTIFWCLMGLTISAVRPLDDANRGRANAPEAAAFARVSPLIYVIAVAMGLIVSLGVVEAGMQVVRQGMNAPRGRLEIAVVPFGSTFLVPGEPVRWVAIYHDADNRDRDTAAGTFWHLNGTNIVGLGRVHPVWKDVTIQGVRHGIMEVVTPDVASAKGGTLSMQVTYLDQHGRRYEANASVDVRAVAAKK